MCGPLVLALPGGQGGRLQLVAGRLLYNAGRILTYSLLGGIFGLVGGVVRMAGFQQLLSVSLGAGIVLAALVSLGAGRRVALSAPFATRGIAVLKGALSRLFRAEARSGLLLIGMLNGLLPCGFVYLGLAGSLTAGSVPGGMAYMALFGLGTVPLMLTVSLTGHLIRAEVRQFARRLLPVGMLVLGALFVLRGLGLDIPYVSPVLDGGMAGHHHGAR
jgi:sulfite exporter TauE/SafE